MNFKSIGLNIAAATVMATGAGIASSPAQALSFNKGTFTAEGKSFITGLDPLKKPTSFDLNFRGFKVTDTTGSLAGGALTGTPSLSPLHLTKDVSGNFNSDGVLNFITGLKYKGEEAFFDLNPLSFLASSGSSVSSATMYSLFSSEDIDFTGVFRTATYSSDSTIAFSVVKNMLLKKPINDAGVNVAIPTPALLPGLVGMGLAAWRKRKGEEAEQAEA